MKRILYMLAGVIALSSTSCKKIAELTKFDIKYNSETTIEAGVATLSPFSITTPEVETQSEGQFEGHNTAKNLIQAITLKELKISIVSPEEQNFDFLKDIEVYISTDEQEEVKIAWKNDIAEAAAKEIILDLSKSDLKPYIMSEKYKLRLKTTTDKILNKDVKIKIANVFRVDANILGL